jgi:O-acetylhomoserine (thiol)-lyase
MEEILIGAVGIPEFTEPSAGYHGLVYHEALGNAAFIAKVRIEGLRLRI